jgi:hypothetical protein
VRFKFATIAAAVVVAALLANHWWVAAQVARIAAAAGRPATPPADFGVDLPASLRFLVKLDHFAIDYGYVLILFVWVVAFTAASIGLGLRDLLVGPKPAQP